MNIPGSDLLYPVAQQVDTATSPPEHEWPHAMIPASPVVLGVAKWPVARRSALGLTPAIVPPIPLRFSARAAAVGLMAEATRLRASEDEAIRICAAAAPPRFSPAAWEVVLTETGYPEEALIALLHALCHGASIDPAPTALLGPPRVDKNHNSLYTHLPLVTEKLAKQRNACTLMTWPSRDVMPCMVAPLGTVTKFEKFADQQNFDEWQRLNKAAFAAASNADFEAFERGTTVNVADLNMPVPPQTTGASSTRIIHDARVGINDRGEAPTFAALTTLREIAHYAQPGDHMWVEDIQSAFKLVSPVPWQAILLASIFLGALFIDTRLTFGLNMSPFLFHACVAHPLAWVVSFVCEKHSVPGRVFQYVDDHIGVARARHAALRLHRCFLTALEWLNVPREPDKHQPAAQRVRALGLIIDTSRATGVVVECPEDKLLRIRDICKQALSRKAISLKKLESLCGMIGFVGVSIHGAFVFTAELRAALYAADADRRKHTTLSAAMRVDLTFWADFAASWNGIEVVRAVPTVPRGHASADAMAERDVSALGIFVCGRGFRIVIDRTVWGGGHYPDAVADIAVLELIAYATLVAVSAALFPSQHVAVVSMVTDNSTVRARVEKGYCRDPHASVILRFIWRVTTVARLTSSLTWIKSEDNALSDAPSRGDQQQFSNALAAYTANLPSSAPAWWPAMLRYEPAARRPFTSCRAGSALFSLVHDLGRGHVQGVQVDAQQVALLLEGIRAELG
jgi:hypothetical protein